MARRPRPVLVSRPKALAIRLRSLTSLEPRESLVVGTSQQYDHLSRLRYVPTPTPDPKDPLNLPPRRKLLALLALALFVAATTAANTAIAALANPVLALDYAGIDARVLTQQNTIASSSFISFNSNKTTLTPSSPALASIAPTPKPPTSLILHLLTTAPLATSFLSSTILTPLSTPLGRRPLLLLSALLTTASTLTAALLPNPTTHLIARLILGISLGAAQTLAPLAALDLHFLPRRARALATLSAAQGFVTLALGAAAPFLIARTSLSWRGVYFITGGLSAVSLVAVFLCVPETRWARTPDELGGKDIYTLRARETRPRLDADAFGARTWGGDLKPWGGGFSGSGSAWREGAAMVRALGYPGVAVCVGVQCVLACIVDVVVRTAGGLVLRMGGRYEMQGVVVAGPLAVMVPVCVWVFGGWVVDRMAVVAARRNHGRREAESVLVGALLPVVAGIGGCVLFGFAGGQVMGLSAGGGRVGTGVVVMLAAGMGAIGFAYLAVNAILSAYLVESYPSLAGPVIANVTSIRNLVAFGVSFKATDWIEQFGFFQVLGLYGAVLAVAAAGLPFVFIYGKRLREWTAGTLEPAVIKEVERFRSLSPEDSLC